jgi:D-sedoheptulose 7-phosphate isomerase
VIKEDLERHRAVFEKVFETLIPEIEAAAQAISDSLRAGGKLLIFGNGGSAADAQHIAAEITGRYVIDRRALPAVALTTDTSALTAIANDYGYDHVFARQIEALARPPDIALGISTSGNSPNVLRALESARSLGCRTIGLSGRDGGKMRGQCDLLIVIPSDETARIQEMHILIGHAICHHLESHL